MPRPPLPPSYRPTVLPPLWMDMLRQDLRYARRTLGRAPGFTAVAVMTLALGIGGTTAIFSVIHAVLLEPLPFPEPDRLVHVHLEATEAPGARARLFPWSYPKYEMLRAGTRSFTRMAGYTSTNLNLGGVDAPERLAVEEVSAAYFPTLGVEAIAGRLFLPEEDSVLRAHPVALLSYDLWRRRFASDPSVVGRTINLSGTQLTVVGVLPLGFRGLTGTADAWVPMMMSPVFEYPEVLDEAGNHWFHVVARLAPGVSFAAAGSELAVVAQRIDQAYRFRAQTGSWSATATPLAETRVDPVVRRSVWILLVAVGFVLLIGCVNIASLLLVRATNRRRELAIRLAIGAERRHLVRQLLVESLLVSLGGGALGLLVARWGGSALMQASPQRAQGPAGLSYLFDVQAASLDPAVLVFALGAALLTGLLVGLPPALNASATSVLGALQAGGSSVGARGVWRRLGAHQLLVAGEIGLALVLLAGAALMLRSFANLSGVETGFDARRVLTFRIAPSDQDLASRDPAGFKAQLLERLAALPGVEAAAASTCAPLTSACNGSLVTAAGDRRFTIGREAPPIGSHYVSPDYFRALGIPLLAGRGFGREDRLGSPRVVIVNRAAAQRLWPGESPLGKRLAVATAYFHGGDSTAVVVGVVGDVRYRAPEEPPEPDVYVPALQGGYGRTLVFVKTRGDPLRLVNLVRREVLALDPALPIFAVRTLDEIAAAATSRTRFAALLLGLFALTALGLAALGVYGVMAYAVSARTREIGLRMALGAGRASVVALVLRQGMVSVGLGAAAGLGAALLLTRVLGSLLYNVTPTDPPLLALVTLLLGLFAFVANYVPARRAAGVEPAEVLWTE